MQAIVLSDEQAEAIVRMAGVEGPVQATLIKRGNDVWRIDVGSTCFFLKIYTKSWYGDDIAGTSFCVEHEAAAWAKLSAHGMAVPIVATTGLNTNNPLGRPFLLTYQLRGIPLTDQLQQTLHSENVGSFAASLRVVGEYLHTAHSITFPDPGYVTFDGPSTPPDPNNWQHRCWSAVRRQERALQDLERDKNRLSYSLATELIAQFSTMASTLAADYTPPRFVFGDCHAHQFFVYDSGEGVSVVSGFVDMEVASAGDPVEDLVKFAIEMAWLFPTTSTWWEPLFDGYGSTPDFSRFKLRLLGAEYEEFCVFGNPAPRPELLFRILNAHDWKTLFHAIVAVPPMRS